MFRKIAQLCAVVFFAQGAFARPRQPREQPKGCEARLNQLSMAYAGSDMDALFIHFVKTVQSVNESGPHQQDRIARKVLNMKAELLNQITDLLPSVLSLSDPARKIQMISSIYHILDTVGVPIQVFGLQVDEQGRLVLPNVVNSQSRRNSAPTVVSSPIGFLAQKEASERDLPDGTHRSIGFTAHSYFKDPVPSRKIGNYQRGILQDNPNMIAVIDRESGQTYFADIRILHASGASLDGHDLELTFNQQAHEWVVTDHNLNNPSGKIGF